VDIKKNLLRALLACAPLLGCADAPQADQPAVAADMRQIALTGSRTLRESSGLAMSLNEQGLLYTIEDSGNQPVLFAFDTTGADRGSWDVGNATDADWEAIATGPCGKEHCVYIGDVGDNKAIIPKHHIYRLLEPKSPTDSVRAEMLEFSYPDGTHDVEAMYVTPAADIYLVTKRPLPRAGNRLRPALVFELPATAWKDGGTTEAALVDSLPIVPGAQPLMLITDASMSPDGKLIAVRTYTQAYVFRADSATGRVDHNAPFAVCDIAPLGEAQGEGIAWIGTGRLAFTSEGKKQPLRLASCPVP
jgi:hypothetical protein